MDTCFNIYICESLEILKKLLPVLATYINGLMSFSGSLLVTRHRDTSVILYHKVIMGYQKCIVENTVHTIQKVITITYRFASKLQLQLSVSQPQQQGEKSVHAYCSQCPAPFGIWVRQATGNSS